MTVSIHRAAQASRSFTDFVDFSDMREFDSWCRALGVTRLQLASAVAIAGSSSEAVREYLKRHK